MTILEESKEIEDKITISSVEQVEKPVAGSPYSTPVEIIVEVQAWAQMNQHAREDLRLECGGIMLGEIYKYKKNLAVCTMYIQHMSAHIKFRGQ